MSHRVPRETVVLIGAAVAVGTVMLTTLWLWRSQRKSTARSVFCDTTRAPSIDSPRRVEVPPSLWRSFEEAAYSVRATPHLALTNGDRLLLYSLYKHIVEGDAPDAAPPSQSWNIMAQHAKHQAWIRMRGMPIRTAIEHYTSAVYHFVSATGTAELDDDMDETQGLGPTAVSRPVMETDDYDADTSEEQKELLQAASRNNVATLIQLLSSASDQRRLVEFADSSGQTALHLAADQGATESVAALMAAGALVNAVDENGISVLQAAVIAGHVETVALLLEHGADPYLEDADGDTPLSCAQDDDEMAMMTLFAKYVKR